MHFYDMWKPHQGQQILPLSLYTYQCQPVLRGSQVAIACGSGTAGAGHNHAACIVEASALKRMREAKWQIEGDEW